MYSDMGIERKKLFNPKEITISIYVTNYDVNRLLQALHACRKIIPREIKII